MAALRGQHPPRLLLGPDLGDVGGAVRHHPQEHAGQPEREHAERIEHDRLLELRHPPRGQAEDRDVRERDRRQRDEGVAEEVERRHALARQERRRRRRGEQRLRRAPEAAHARRDHRERHHAEGQEEHGLERVHPGRAAHAAEEHVAHHDQRHDRPAEPIGHAAAADRLQRRSPAHHADDDVGHEQGGLHGEDRGADVAASPSGRGRAAPA